MLEIVVQEGLMAFTLCARGICERTLPRKFEAVQSTTTTKSRPIPTVCLANPAVCGSRESREEAILSLCAGMGAEYSVGKKGVEKLWAGSACDQIVGDFQRRQV